MRPWGDGGREGEAWTHRCCNTAASCSVVQQLPPGMAGDGIVTGVGEGVAMADPASGVCAAALDAALGGSGQISRKGEENKYNLFNNFGR